MNKRANLAIATITPLIILFIPSSWIPIESLTVIEHRVIALFFLAALYWVMEPIPVYSTSLLVVVLELLMISDKGLIWLRSGSDPEAFGTLLSHIEIMSMFASPIIMLFLGGFFLAMATTKYQLDSNLARVMLKPFGNKPRNILLGLMIITAVFSMFMSNTATTAMMLAILTPVFASFPAKDPCRTGFALAIPFAANVGGIGTPIGTPPNAIALKYLTGDQAIGFGTWMLFAVPFVLVMLIILWQLLLLFFPSDTETVELKIEGIFQTNWKAITVYITFIGTVFLWLTDFWHGMNSYVIAMIPVGVFSITQIINKEDLKRISWDVLWLVAGGFALGLALEKSGLSLHLIQSIPFASLSPILVILLFTFITFTMANFMSHTATANLIMPIVAALAISLPSLEPFGGGRMLILVVTFAASLAMTLAVSTPPNAIAYSTGAIESKHMMKTGLIMGVAGIAMSFVMMYALQMINFF